MTSLREKLRGAITQGLPRGFLGDLGWQYASTIASLGFGFGQTLVLGRGLGSARLGVIALAMTYATLIFEILEPRLHDAVVKYVAEFRESGDEQRVVATAKLALLTDATTGLLAVLVALAAAPFARKLFLQDVEYRFVLLATITIAFNNIALATSVGLLRLFQRYKASAIATVTLAGSKLVVSAFGVFVLRWDAFEVMLLSAAVSFASNVVMAALALQTLRRHTSVGWRDAPLGLLRNRLREMGGFVGSTYLSSLSAIPFSDVDVAILGMHRSLADVGTYRIAKNFMQAVWALADPAFVVIYPVLAQIWARRDAASLRPFLRRVSFLGGGLLSVVSITSFFVVPWCIALLLGSGFSDSGTSFRWMVWAAAIWGATLWIQPLLTAAGRPLVMVAANVVSGIITVGAYLLLVPSFGAKAAAFVYAAATPLGMALAWQIARMVKAFDMPARPADESSDST